MSSIDLDKIKTVDKNNALMRENLIYLLWQKGIKPNEITKIARLTGVSKGVVNFWINHSSNFGKKAIYAICSTFDVDVTTFMTKKIARSEAHSFDMFNIDRKLFEKYPALKYFILALNDGNIEKAIKEIEDVNQQLKDTNP